MGGSHSLSDVSTTCLKVSQSLLEKGHNGTYANPACRFNGTLYPLTVTIFCAPYCDVVLGGFVNGVGGRFGGESLWWS